MSQFGGIGFGALTDLTAAMLPKVHKRWQDTQGQIVYSGINAFNFANGEMLVQEEAKDNIRVGADGNTVRMGYYGQSSSRGFTFNVTQTTPAFRVQNTGLFFDMSEKVFNRGDIEIFDHFQQKYSAVAEELHTEIDNQVVLPPDSVADENNSAGRCRGLLYWLPASAVGVASDPVGGFNGTTMTRGDGTTTTTIGGVDRSTARNARTASFQINYSGSVDDQMRQALIRTVNRIGFEPLDGLRGEKPSKRNPNTLFMPPSQYEEIIMWQNKGPDDNNGHLIRYETIRPILGMVPRQVPQWSSLAYAPIVGVRMSKWKVEKGRWMYYHKPKVDQNNSNIAMTQVDNDLRLRCCNPREGGFCMSIAR